MTLNSNNPTQAKADRLPAPKCSEIPHSREHKRLASVKTPKALVGEKKWGKSAVLNREYRYKDRDFRTEARITPTLVQ